MADPGLLEHGCELWAIGALSRGQRLAALFTGQVNLRGLTAAGAAQRVISRLRAGWLDLIVGAVSGAGGVLMGMVDRGIDRDVPGDQPGHVSPGLQPHPDPGPHPGALPAPEQPIDRLLASVAFKNIPPRRTDSDPPPNPVDQLPPRPDRRPARPLPAGQQRCQDPPLPVCQVRSIRWSTRSPVRC